MPRLYLPLPLVSGQRFDLPDTTARHIQVLRLQPGNTVRLFNGEGGEYEATVTTMGKRNVEIEIGAHHAVDQESPLQLTLVQALSAAERMDYTIQKATELGVQCVQIVQSAYCGYKLAADRVEKRMAHWQGVAVAAAEQCGRTRIPTILPPMRFDGWLAAMSPADLRLLLSPTGAKRLSELPAQATAVQVLIGPEGGFSDEEEHLAIEQGFTPLILGPRLFRTETVAPVIAALLQARYGDF